MALFFTIIIFILIFSALVLIHEYGHFFVARKSGIKVEEFGFGLPPRIWGFKKGGTLYSLNAIPFGGFVRLLGEDLRNPKMAKNPRSFISKSPGVRLMVILAGVFMNFLLAFVLLSAGFMIGIQPLILNGDDILNSIRQGTIQTEQGVVIKEVFENGQKAGLRTGDRILATGGRKLTSSSQLHALLNTSQNVEITLDILRANAGNAYLRSLHLRAGEKNIGFKTYETLFLPRLAVSDVAMGSPFYESGLRPGDFLLKVNNVDVYGIAEWNQILRDANKLQLLVLSDGQMKNLSVALPQRERVVISEVSPWSPADKAGFLPGDVIVSINGESVSAREDVIKIIQKSRNQQMLYLARRGVNIHELKVKAGDDGLIGVGLSLILPYQNNQISFYQADVPASVLKINDVRYAPWIAPLRALEDIWRLSGATVGMFVGVVKSLVTRFAVPEGISGPVGIAKLTYTFVAEGMMPVLRFVAVLSMSLAIINVLPFPALDGGRLVFILVEIILRRKINARFESVVHGIGFFLLMVFILAITYSDILKLF